MKRFLFILLACVLLTSCGKKDSIKDFKNSTDTLTEKVEQNKKFMELQEEFDKALAEIKDPNTSEARKKDLLDELKRIQKEQDAIVK